MKEESHCQKSSRGSFSIRRTTIACGEDFRVEEIVPEANGMYGWCFRTEDFPGGPSAEEFFQVGSESLILFYLGISPNGEDSSGNLKKRLETHLEGTARRSTLRYSLGALLDDELHLEVVPEGEKKLSFGDTEPALTKWIREHGHVAWMEHEKPWEIEEGLIHLLHPPLNLAKNPENPFRKILKKKRKILRSKIRVR